MRFVFQKENVSSAEKRAVRHFACLAETSAPVEISIAPELSTLRKVPPASQRGQALSCPVGTVEFCQAWMRATGIPEPAPLDYPAPLRWQLGRPVKQFDSPSQVPAGWWVKPIATKKWEATSIDLVRGSLPEEPLWGSPAQVFGSEFRAYVLDGQVHSVARYDPLEEPEPLACEVYEFASGAVAEWAEKEEIPCAFALDVGVNKGAGCLQLIEVTDAWAIGFYAGTNVKKYAQMLHARWAQLSQAGSLKEELSLW
jgi:hypothetical protein